MGSQMKGLTDLKNLLSGNKHDLSSSVTLYRVMEKVGGYEQLMNLSFPALREIIKCMNYVNKEESKAMKIKR